MVAAVYNPAWYEQEYFCTYPYVGGYQDYARHGAVVDRVLDMLRPSSVLDVGCAYGYVVRRLLHLAVPAMGCDVSRWCEQQAAKVIPSHFVRTNAWQLAMFRDKEFDLLFCEGVLEHIPEDKVEQLMREFGRVAQRRLLALSYNKPEVLGDTGVLHHLTNHDVNWWIERVPAHTYLGYTGRSVDIETLWVYKDA